MVLINSFKKIKVMSERMYAEGYNSITNIDFSKKCIKEMQEMYKDFGESFKCLIFF